MKWNYFITLLNPQLLLFSLSADHLIFESTFPAITPDSETTFVLHEEKIVDYFAYRDLTEA